MADINELEKQISNLPIGYVIEKIINGKKYYYQQWKENGKTKNRCISEEEAKILKPQIEKRKHLQKSNVRFLKSNTVKKYPLFSIDILIMKKNLPLQRLNLEKL